MEHELPGFVLELSGGVGYKLIGGSASIACPMAPRLPTRSIAATREPSCAPT